MCSVLLIVAASYPCSDSVAFLCFVSIVFCASFGSSLNFRFDLMLGGEGWRDLVRVAHWWSAALRAVVLILCMFHWSSLQLPTILMVCFSIGSLQSPDKIGGGQCPGEALLVKRRNSKWSFTNEPEVRFRFWLRLELPYVPVWPGLSRFKRLPSVPSRLAKCPGFSLQWSFQN